MRLDLELLEQSPCAQAIVALDGAIQYSNPAFRMLLNIPRPNVHSSRFQHFLTPGAAIFYQSQFLPTLLQREKVSGISLDLCLASGEQIPVFADGVLRRSEAGEPAGLFLAMFDARQRRLYEKELLRARKEAERLSEVVRRSSDAILRLSPQGVIQSWNEGARQMFGWSGDEILDSFITRLFEKEAVAEVQNAIELLHRGTQVVREFTGVRKDGSPLSVSVSLTPHLEAPGILVAFSAILRDVTSQKLSERALLQNEKLASVGRLASSIAHEINNPLEAVTNLLYILQCQPLDPSSLTLVSTAQDELARVTQIATQTLRFYRQSSNRTAIDVAALVDSVFGLYRARFAGAGVQAINDSRNASPLVCFEGEVRQILVNLVSNAYDAMKAGGKLIIRTRDTALLPNGSHGVRITVADTGSGMSRETASRVFEPFFTTKGIGGTGLGMWITSQLAKKNQGQIRVRSCAVPGKNGTVFSIAFPHC